MRETIKFNSYLLTWDAVKSKVSPRGDQEY